MHDYLMDFLIFLLAAVIAVPVFRLFKTGAILAYLFAGVVIGPEVLKLFKEPETILHFSELGVVLLLFVIGLELHPEKLWKMRREVFGLGGLQVFVTGGIFFLIGRSFGLPVGASVVAGFGLALSSTAFGIQILEEHRQFRTLHGQGSFSILLFQDLAVVPLIALVPILAGGDPKLPTWLDVVKVIAIVATIILMGRYGLNRWLRLVAEARVQEVFIATSLLVVVGTALLMESAGLSMGMGAFLAGMILANSEYRHELEANLAPFKGLLMGLFFIAVGMSLDLSVLAEQPLTVFSLVVSFLVIKGLVIYGLARAFSFPHESSRNMASTLPQGGEFAFVIYAAALSNGIFDQQLSSMLNASVTISMALTPFIFGFNQRRRLYHEISERPTDVEDEGAVAIIAGYGRFGQIVSRFLHTQHIPFTILEHSAAQVDTARRFGQKIFFGDASRYDIVEAAGAKNAKLFILAIDDVESSIETARMVRERFPHLEIIARVRNRQHAIDLMALGVTNIHRETYLTSLEVAKETLLFLGQKRENINKKLAKFRTHDEEILRQQYQFKGDEKGYISMTNKANAELERLLRSDVVED